jgi:hypothetical protein
MINLLIDIFVVFIVPSIFLFTLVASLNWLLDRLFGYDPLAPYQAGFHQTIQAEFIQNAGSFSSRKAREAKITPRYDALVDAEWDRSRLEDSVYEEDLNEIHSLSDLLETKSKD